MNPASPSLPSPPTIDTRSTTDPHPPAPRLHAPPLILEPLTADQAEPMFEVLSERSLYAYLDDEPPASVAALREVYRRRERGRSPDGSELWFNWLLTLPDAGWVGFVQASMTDPQSCWIGYLLSSAVQGRGHATRAVARMVAHLRSHHGAERLLASVERANRPSIALLERLEFSLASPEEHAMHGLGPTEQLYVRFLAR
ncbi:GNAT family N-acetyltransferase [Roseateles amylovorans]|uniref:GNAT family N-acetyltransferase n=1 Tax=Roseateles amylovorans TaxID=2978473 RepID=A0ABY6AWM4_9BURK|nr:GNAT family N-acetyltransferase [Roseateles amylovorans]UXH77594.1 GNAT family N-acetyltransferase [Roseateles amylovorans]